MEENTAHKRIIHELNPAYVLDTTKPFNLLEHCKENLSFSLKANSLKTGYTHYSGFSDSLNEYYLQNHFKSMQFLFCISYKIKLNSKRYLFTLQE